MFPGPVRQRFARGSVHRDPRLDGIDEYFRAAAPATAADLARFVYAYRAARTGRAGLAIKSDDLWAHVQALDRVLPQRRVVLLTRDFRDNAMSIVGKPFGPRMPAVAAEYVRARFIHYEREYRRRLTGGAYVRFEDLVGAPARAIDTLGRTLGLGGLGRGDSSLDGLTIRTGRVGRWRALPRRELAWCEAILRRELVNYDYGLATTGAFAPTLWDQLSTRSADAALRVPQKIRYLRRRLNA